ncbi:hypothetical protein [Phaeocystidibacter marisrubri]|uniref:Uncharacterized protein n=1 Tax=Phaeocystidibacter marisrubri TaxID=1577780 RepID=A0A6L3ZHA0_9FLAO|nr:hypothetical protein [Phaeocystidibacter marisrubri]KAB2817392.1 hypothetical protein F8C82_03075 [Phaeocystidibacter marisrubri]GGH75577.1 hypothetical protein GCM10011318_22740 [Phaeocystidibacter marisrubri]
MKTYILFAFLGVGGIACTTTTSSITDRAFVAPKIVNSQPLDKQVPDTSALNEMRSSDIIYMGRHNWKREIDIYSDKLGDENFADRYPTSDRMADSMDIVGLTIVPDYDQTIWYAHYPSASRMMYSYYPIFIINTTNTNKLFQAKDTYILGIQEAVDSTNGRYGHWFPIEHRPFDFCGNGRFYQVLQPGQFILALVRKYHGDCKTSMRLRLQIGENIFVTKGFEGYINEQQFELRDSSSLARQVKEDPIGSISYSFMGATPRVLSH